MPIATLFDGIAAEFLPVSAKNGRTGRTCVENIAETAVRPTATRVGQVGRPGGTPHGAPRPVRPVRPTENGSDADKPNERNAYPTRPTTIGYHPRETGFETFPMLASNRPRGDVPLDPPGDPDGPCRRCGQGDFWREAFGVDAEWVCVCCDPPVPDRPRDACAVPPSARGVAP